MLTPYVKKKAWLGRMIVLGRQKFDPAMTLPHIIELIRYVTLKFAQSLAKAGSDLATVIFGSGA